MTNSPETPDLSAAALQMLGKWNYQIAALYGKRIHELYAFPFSLMLCTSFDDVTDAQQRYSAILLADYRAAAKNFALASNDAKGDTRGSKAGEIYAETLLRAQDDARNIIDQALAHAQRIISDAEVLVAKPQAVGDKTRAA